MRTANSQGYAALQMANILNNIELNQWPVAMPRAALFDEAKRLAYEDVANTTPILTADITEEWLLSSGYGKAVH